MKPSIAAATALAALLLVAALPAAFAQAGTPADKPAQPVEGPPPSGDETASNPFRRGDQTIALGAGLQIPLFIAPAAAGATADTTLLLGGAFSFQYQYFVSTGIAIGGTIAGAFNGTIGGRSVFVAPLSFRTAYWWSILPFEFCAGGELGAYLVRLDGNGVIGPFAKAGGGAFWKTSSAWSLGLQSYFWLVPEIHTGAYADLTRWTGFMEVSLAAVYHL